jgi:hypothetical protein
MAMYLPAVLCDAGLWAAILLDTVLWDTVLWDAMLAQPAASRTEPAVTRLATAARPCMSVTLPPVMDTSKAGRWFSRVTINSGTPRSDRVTAAD